jgi:hypothetical protein
MEYPAEDGGGLEWLPVGAIAHFDEENDRYYAAGSEQEQSWFVTGTGPSDWVMTADFLALWNAEQTHRFDFTRDGASSGQLFEVFDAAAYGDADNNMYSYINGATTMKFEDYADLNLELSVVENGANRIVLNVFDDAGGGDVEAVVSSNGGAIQTSLAFARETWITGHFGWGEESGPFSEPFVYTCFPLTAVGDLPALSTL